MADELRIHKGEEEGQGPTPALPWRITNCRQLDHNIKAMGSIRVSLNRQICM
jgi:hypothetical protein